MKRLFHWIDGKIDLAPRSYSMNWTIALIVIWSCDVTLGIMQVFKYIAAQEPVYLVLGTLNMVLGMLGVYFHIRILHAIVRSKVAQARASSF